MTPANFAPFVSRAPQLSKAPWAPLAEFIHRELHPQRPAYSEEDKRFLALAIAGEVGEFCNLVKKDWQEEGGIAKPKDGDRAEKKRLELADIRIYLEMLALAYNVDLDRACSDKLAICLDRWPEIREKLASMPDKASVVEPNLPRDLQAELSEATRKGEELCQGYGALLMLIHDIKRSYGGLLDDKIQGRIDRAIGAAQSDGHAPDPVAIDHRLLLKKYVSHVLDCEGAHFIGRGPATSAPPALQLTPDDVAALKKIATELGCAFDPAG